MIMGGRVCEKNPPFLVVHYQFIPLKNHGISININDAGFRFFSTTLDMSLKKGLQRILHFPKLELYPIPINCTSLELASSFSRLQVIQSWNFFFRNGMQRGG